MPPAAGALPLTPAFWIGSQARLRNARPGRHPVDGSGAGQGFSFATDYAVSRAADWGDHPSILVLSRGMRHPTHGDQTASSEQQGRTLRYVRVANGLRDAIVDGTYPAGTQLLSQHRLAAQFGVAFNTLRQALDLLENEGYIVRLLGRGTFTAVPDLRMGSILVVDDDVFIGGLFTRFVSPDEYELVTVTSGEDALAILDDRPFDLVFLDLAMPDLDGPETLARMRERGHDAPVVIITAFPEPELLIQVLELGPAPLIRKPFGAEDVREAIERFISPRIRAARGAGR